MIWNLLDVASFSPSPLILAQVCKPIVVNPFVQPSQTVRNSSNICTSMPLGKPSLLPETKFFWFSIDLTVTIYLLFVSRNEAHSSTEPSLIHLSHFNAAPCMPLQHAMHTPRTAFITGLCTWWFTCLLVPQSSMFPQGQRLQLKKLTHTYIRNIGFDQNQWTSF